ncbi:hypothetical protein BJ508DRAFT_325551 [Ascobolus immersus RN42]|uniref:Transmembrane protein n=1 Tax=Ascobolus immersus RN42 TaxID=1160509 RepID=A0A3N4IDG3_ASCIM|nr:hypothetical protein BJ508DRAFT_325551 [Ascobolus immersus RN42]
MHSYSATRFSGHVLPTVLFVLGVLPLLYPAAFTASAVPVASQLSSLPDDPSHTTCPDVSEFTWAVFWGNMYTSIFWVAFILFWAVIKVYRERKHDELTAEIRKSVLAEEEVRRARERMAAEEEDRRASKLKAKEEESRRLEAKLRSQPSASRTVTAPADGAGDASDSSTERSPLLAGTA